MASVRKVAADRLGYPPRIGRRVNTRIASARPTDPLEDAQKPRLSRSVPGLFEVNRFATLVSQAPARVLPNRWRTVTDGIDHAPT